MSDFIQVNIRDAENFTSAVPQQRNFVVAAGRDAIRDDLARGKESLVRQRFHDMPDLESFVEEHFEEVQQTIAGDVALTHARRTRPQHLHTLPVDFDFQLAAPPDRPADHAVGDFLIWKLATPDI